MINNCFFLLLGLCCLGNTVRAQGTYPFVVPNTITAELDVRTGGQEAFRNPLLGYNIFGFNSALEKEFVRRFDPITVRFPHGLFANWYDWRTDGTRVFGTETFDYIFRDRETRTAEIDELSSIETFDRINRKVGIDGLEQLNDERLVREGTGFDIVWTFNMSADAEAGATLNEAPETLGFYDDLISRGLAVTDVELGNENFYPGQRSSFIPNATDYVARAKAMAQALKSRDPDVKVSIPLLRRGSFVDPNWNAKLTQDGTYFDAVTVHTYIGADPDNADNSDDAYSTALTARKSLASSTNNFVRPFTTKPVWLTEWGVQSGGPNAASVLGMADCYLFMAENQDIYQRANWFSVNGKLNSFVAFTDKANGSKDQIKYPLEKTAYGLAHEILNSVLANSVLLEGTMTTLELESGVDAVTARAVTKDGRTAVLIINLTDKSVPFTLKIDGTPYTEPFVHRAMQFATVGEERELPFGQDPLSVIKEGMGDITLPPLSISTVYLGDDAYLAKTNFVPDGGIVEAEDYDEGGPDVAYGEKADGRTGSNLTYRPTELVDLQNFGSRIVTFDNKFNEYQEYTLNVTKADNYDIIFTYASNSATSSGQIQVSVELPGQATADLGGRVMLPSTPRDAAGNPEFATVTKTGVQLPVGNTVLRFTTKGGGYGLDFFEVVPTPIFQAGFLGTNEFTNGVLALEAEDYDAGGPEVAYFDKSDATADGGNNPYRPGDGVDVRNFGSVTVIEGNEFNEWQEYTIDVPTAGEYVFEFNYFTGRNGTVRIQPDVDNNAMTFEVPLPRGGSPTDFVTSTSGNISLVAGEQVLRFTVAGGGYNLDRVTISEAVLPVDWLTFTGVAEQKFVNLAWRTAGEVANEGFTVQRSGNGVDWANLDFVAASATGEYGFRDQQPAAGINYYRLEQRDFDGTTDLSVIVQVDFASTFAARLFPNPTTDGIELVTQQTIVNARLLDVNGRTLRVISGDVRRLDVSDLSVGTYYLELTGAEGVRTLRFQKSNQ
ncbi:carbohydrate-binding protein [Neolewinella antarctica]|uniref:CBM6 domain-containing protein n=1 Tax=Neolewinella antarctica TaxID=442734 RepID=A0ABX0XHZ5_9BACT|nr:carbohydrate-binding protein [Neolewinella antarctica]NJC28453.1 hypothetical protein [Neolewinella antarctica]